MKNRIFFILAAGIFAGLISCQKAKLNKSLTSATDNSTAETMFGDVYKEVGNAADEDAVNGKDALCLFAKDTVFTKGCRTITVNLLDTPNCWPKRITIDYGTDCYDNSDGSTRSGRIIIVMTGKFRDAGTTLTATLDSFKVNGFRIEGAKSLTNNGLNAAGRLYYTLNVTGARITNPEGETFSWESTRTHEWKEGNTTILNLCDDIWSVTGNAHGVDRQKRAFTAEITTPLIKKVCCRWLVSGVIKLTRDGLKEQVIDFGNGDCDAKATRTVGNNSEEITLR